MRNRMVLIVLVLLNASCFRTVEERPIYSREIAQVGEFRLKEDMLRFRLRLELNKLPKDYVEKHRKQKLDNANPLKPILDSVLNKMIEDYAILSYGAKNTIKIPDEELVTRFEQAKARFSQKELESILNADKTPYHRWKQLTDDQISVQYVLEKSLEGKLNVTSQEIREYYNKNRDEFRTDEQIRIRHIVTDTKEKAEDILNRIKNGENFAKLAVNHSISPDRARGGTLGYFSRGQFPPIFDTAFSLEKGEVSGIIKSEYGYHIFKLLEKKPARVRPPEEVSGPIQQKIFEEKLKTHYKKWIEGVLKEIPVSIDKDYLENFIL